MVHTELGLGLCQETFQSHVVEVVHAQESGKVHSASKLASANVHPVEERLTSASQNSRPSWWNELIPTHEPRLQGKGIAARFLFLESVRHLELEDARHKINLHIQYGEQSDASTETEEQASEKTSELSHKLQESLRSAHN